MIRRPRSSLERLPHAIAEQVVKRIVELLDVDDVVRRIDVNDVVRRVDINAVMERVDIDSIVDRLDINAIADKIDVDELVRRADLGPLIAQSTSGMVGEFLTLLRRQVVTLDDLLDRVTRRDGRGGAPTGPAPMLAAAAELKHPNREGQYAGGITRMLALVTDVFAGWGIFTLLVAAINAAAGLVSAGSFSLLHHRVESSVVAVVWAFLYFSFGWALTGRTIGMAMLGIRVVTADGRDPSGRAAALRTLVLPVGVLTFFIAMFRSDRRALQDLCAGTCVVYNWEARGDRPLRHRDAAESSGVA